jgi:formyl-CoA transferase
MPRSGRTMAAVGTPIRIRGEERPATRPGPEVGEHTDEVLLGAGFTREEVQSLRSAGVIAG